MASLTPVSGTRATGTSCHPQRRIREEDAFPRPGPDPPRRDPRASFGEEGPAGAEHLGGPHGLSPPRPGPLPVAQSRKLAPRLPAAMIVAGECGPGSAWRRVTSGRRLRSRKGKRGSRGAEKRRGADSGGGAGRLCSLPGPRGSPALSMRGPGAPAQSPLPGRRALECVAERGNPACGRLPVGGAVCAGWVRLWEVEYRPR